MHPEWTAKDPYIAVDIKFDENGNVLGLAMLLRNAPNMDDPLIVSATNTTALTALKLLQGDCLRYPTLVKGLTKHAAIRLHNQSIVWTEGAVRTDWKRGAKQWPELSPLYSPVDAVKLIDNMLQLAVAETAQFYFT